MPELSLLDAFILVVPQVIILGALYGVSYVAYRLALSLMKKAKVALNKHSQSFISNHTAAH
ncbi:hypothetical protein [Vibrio comitans]